MFQGFFPWGVIFWWLHTTVPGAVAYLHFALGI